MNALLTQPVLLTAAETAALLRIDRRTVWRWGAAGRLDAVRLGPNTVRYRRASVEALIEGHDSTHNDTSKEVASP
jgi:excisionase family DNA binding protein